MHVFEDAKGVVKFDVPEGWLSSPSDAGVEFFPPGAELAPTLRVNVITARSPNPPVTMQTVVDLLRESPRHPGAPIRRTSDGHAFVHYSIDTTEDDVPLRIFFWEVGAPLPPRHARIVVFALTTIAGDAAAATSDLVSQISVIVNAVQLSQPAVSRKPWWQFWRGAG